MNLNLIPAPPLKPLSIAALLCFLVWAQPTATGQTTTQPLAGQSTTKCPGIDNTKTFINSLYQDVLGRDLDRQGFRFWMDKILACAPNDANCVNFHRSNTALAFLLSGEFYAKTNINMNDNGEFVRTTYRRLLKREATPAELDSHISQLNSNGDKRLVIATVIASNEYRSRCFPSTQSVILSGWGATQGHTAPTAFDVESNWREMEQVSFLDGLAINLTNNSNHLRTNAVMSRAAMNGTDRSPAPESYGLIAEKIKTATDNWKVNQTLTENFLWLKLNAYYTPDFSWEENALWAQINANATAAAKISKDANLKGMFFDPEDYGCCHADGSRYSGVNVWGMNLLSTTSSNTIRIRGRNFMTSILSVYPDITIMTTGAQSLIEANGTDKYGLAVPFFNGMLEVIREKQHEQLNDGKPGARYFNDGLEMFGKKGINEPTSQYYWSSGFQCANSAGEYIGAPQYPNFTCVGSQYKLGGGAWYWSAWLSDGLWEYHRHNYARYALGAPSLWLDASRVWDAEPASDGTFPRHFYSPDDVVTHMTNALKVSDRYAWIYAERPLFFRAPATDPNPNPAPVPNVHQYYLDAFQKAKSKAEAELTPVSSASARAVFVKTDSTTKGNWINKYGATGYATTGWDVSLPPYVQLSMPNIGVHGWDDDMDVRSLQRPGTTYRTPRSWYSILDGLTTDFYINFTDGNQHQVAFYCMGKVVPQWNTQEIIEIRDRETDALLSRATAANFNDGKYLVWNIKGNVHVRVVLSNGYRPLINGIFID